MGAACKLRLNHDKSSRVHVCEQRRLGKKTGRPGARGDSAPKLLPVKVLLQFPIPRGPLFAPADLSPARGRPPISRGCRETISSHVVTGARARLARARAAVREPRETKVRGPRAPARHRDCCGSEYSSFPRVGSRAASYSGGRRQSWPPLWGWHSLLTRGST